MEKRTFYSEASYIIGLVILAFATAMTEAADFGLSMVVAPAYLLHLKISEFLPFFTFGMAEYTLQAFLILLITIILKKFRFSFLFSFVTAVLYGFLLDSSMMIIDNFSVESMPIRIVFFVVGVILCSFSISLLFHTYISPEAYELFVKEVSAKFGIDISKFKMAYDCASFIISVIITFAFFGFGNFVGINIGTVISAFVNGPLIGLFGKLLEKHFNFKDKFNLRKYFE